MPRADSALITRTCGVSPERPISGRAASRLVGATPGCETVLLIPHPCALLRRLSSSPNRPQAIFDWLYARCPL